MPAISDVTEAFGKRLRELRRRKGLGSSVLAKKAGLSLSYIGFIERGERNPTLETVAKLAAALEIDPGELLRELPKPSPHSRCSPDNDR